MSMVLLIGCDSMQKMLAGLDTPTANIKGVRFDGISLEQANMLFDIEISNPYSVALPLTSIDYGLATEGSPFASGKVALDGNVPAKGSRTIALPVNLTFAELLKSASGIRLGQIVPYKADMSLSVNAPGVGPLSLPLTRKGEVPVPAVPKVSLTSVDFESLTLSEAAAVLKIDVANTNEFDIDLNKFGYALKLGGTDIVATEVSKAASFKPGQNRTLEIPIRFKPSSLGLAAFNMLGGKDAKFELSGDMQLSTRFGALSLPYRQSGTTVLER